MSSPACAHPRAETAAPSSKRGRPSLVRVQPMGDTHPLPDETDTVIALENARPGVSLGHALRVMKGLGLTIVPMAAKR